MEVSRNDFEDIKRELRRVMLGADQAPGANPEPIGADRLRMIMVIGQLVEAGEAALLQNLGVCALQALVQVYRAEAVAARAVRCAGLH